MRDVRDERECAGSAIGGISLCRAVSETVWLIVVCEVQDTAAVPGRGTLVGKEPASGRPSADKSYAIDHIEVVGALKSSFSTARLGRDAERTSRGVIESSRAQVEGVEGVIGGRVGVRVELIIGREHTETRVITRTLQVEIRGAGRGCGTCS